MKKPRCHNCKFAGDAFKIFKLTHNHCHHPRYAEETNPWETLRVFSNTCEHHEFKGKK